MSEHEHLWMYMHAQIQGRSRDESAVVRYCATCGLRQVAFTGPWQRATAAYAADEHYDPVTR